MCYKAVDRYTLGLEFVPDCYFILLSGELGLTKGVTELLLSILLC